MKRLGAEDTSILALMAELAENDRLTKQARTVLASRLKSRRAQQVGRVLIVKKPAVADSETGKVAGYFQKWAKANSALQSGKLIGNPIKTKTF